MGHGASVTWGHARPSPSSRNGRQAAGHVPRALHLPEHEGAAKAAPSARLGRPASSAEKPQSGRAERRMPAVMPPGRMALVSHTALIITVAYSIAFAIGLAIAFGLYVSTRRPVDDDRGTWGRRETAWLVIMIVVLFALLMGTIFYVPYGDSAGPRNQLVRVTGVQFAWAIDAPQPIVTGRPVTFIGRSRDVA